MWPGSDGLLILSLVMKRDIFKLRYMMLVTSLGVGQCATVDVDLIEYHEKST